MKFVIFLVAALAVSCTIEARVVESRFPDLDSAVRIFEKIFSRALTLEPEEDTTIDPEETESTSDIEETTEGETSIDPEETTVDPEETTEEQTETTPDPDETTEEQETTTEGDQGQYPIFQRSCEVRKAELREAVRTPFSVAAYSGQWFEIERYQQRDESLADCLESFYSWNFIRRRFTIIRTGFDFLANEFYDRAAHGFLSFPESSPVEGLLNITYNIVDGEANVVNYYVLGTDYYQYAIGWACEDIGEEGEELSREFAWILSRTPQLPDDPVLLARIESYVDRFLDRSFIRWTLQDPAYCLDRVSPGGRV